VDLRQAGKHTPDTLPVTAKLANRRRSLQHDTKRACSKTMKLLGNRPKRARERVLLTGCKESRAA
jgi:hypothetical protein